MTCVFIVCPKCCFINILLLRKTTVSLFSMKYTERNGFFFLDIYFFNVFPFVEFFQKQFTIFTIFSSSSFFMIKGNLKCSFKIKFIVYYTLPFVQLPIFFSASLLSFYRRFLLFPIN